MSEHTNQIVSLMFKHFRNELTPSENERFKAWLLEHKEHQTLLETFTCDEKLEGNLRSYINSEIPDAWDKFQQRRKMS